MSIPILSIPFGLAGIAIILGELLFCVALPAALATKWFADRQQQAGATDE